MIIGQVGAEDGRAGERIGDAVLHRDRRGKAVDHAESDRAIMAAQTKLRGSGGLAGHGFGCGAAVRRVRRRGKSVIP